MTTQDDIKKILNSNLDLDTQRMILADQSYSDAFPGSAAAKEAKEYRQAVIDFDAKHPQIIAAIKADETKKHANESKEAKDLGWI